MKNILPGHLRVHIRELEAEIIELHEQLKERDVLKDREYIDDMIIKREQEYKSLTGEYFTPKGL